MVESVPCPPPFRFQHFSFQRFSVSPSPVNSIRHDNALLGRAAELANTVHDKLRPA